MGCYEEFRGMSESEEEGVRSMPGSAEMRCSSGGERELHPQLVGRVQVVRVSGSQ